MTCKIMILFVVLWFLIFVHTNLFIDLVCFMDLDVSKGARLIALKPREMAHCDVVYPNTECNTVNVVKTFSNG